MNEYMTATVKLKTAAGLFALALLCGCASAPHSNKLVMPAPQTFSEADSRETELSPNRMLVWDAYLSIEVSNVSNAMNKAITITKENGGYVEQRRIGDDGDAGARLRIPAKVFNPAVGSLGSLGTVKLQHVEGRDVTEQRIDVVARLKNKIALRNRLTKLLDKAIDVKDILAIEKELNRTQSDIDSIQGRLKLMESQVEFATIELTLSRKPVPGPIGYVLKGLWWCLEKLFVIRR